MGGHLKTIIEKIYDTIPAVVVILFLGIVGCENTNYPTEAAVSGESVNAGIQLMPSVKVSPPFILNVDYKPAVADEPVPVKVDITPTQDVEQLVVDWTLPEGANMIAGEMRKTLGPGRIPHGTKNIFEVKLRPGKGIAQQAVVTVQVLWQGHWYGAAKGIELKAGKAPEPAYKIAPGDSANSGYIETPMEPVK